MTRFQAGATLCGALFLLPLAAFSQLALPAAPQALSSSLGPPDSRPPASLAAVGATPTRPVTRPFSAVGIAAKLGISGIGFDIATPLSDRFNLRGGASFFGISTSTPVDGIIVNGTLDLRNVAATVDFFPWRNAFRMSAGVTLYNNNNLDGTASVPGGQTFKLDDVTYLSSLKDPVTGTAHLKFGNRVAPRLTIGAGNIVPRGSRRFSFPFEAGFQYIADPTVALNLAGSVTDELGQDHSINEDPSTRANVVAEQNDLTNSLTPLRFFPILTIGFSYKFGR